MPARHMGPLARPSAAVAAISASLVKRRALEKPARAEQPRPTIGDDRLANTPPLPHSGGNVFASAHIAGKPYTHTACSRPLLETHVTPAAAEAADE